MNLAGKIALMFSSLLLSVSVSAAWTLNGSESYLYYVTNKASVIAELNSFGGLSGEITDDGGAFVDIALGTVDTLVDIRNERMRDIVFEISRYPLASISLFVNSSALESMMPGTSMQGTYSGNVNIKGMGTSVNMELLVTKLADGSLLVQNIKPILLNVQAIGLGPEVEELRELAALPSINPNIVVNVKLVFDPDM